MNSRFPAALRGAKAGVAVVFVILVLSLIGGYLVYRPGPTLKPPEKMSLRPALTVQLVSPQREDWPLLLPATGSVLAWQEAVIGPELANYRLTEVRAQVGDRVKRGQVLARIADDTVATELAEAKALQAELQATAVEAKGNAERARELRAKGFYSAQLYNQYQTAEHTANARLAAARARVQAAEVKLGKTSVLAPDDGVISVSTAAVGSLTQPGQELFRLIRGGRLEWRAEVTSADLAKVKAGQMARLDMPDGTSVPGKVRSVAPSVDPQTRNGLVYVDLAAGNAVRAGMFARGHFELSHAPALTVPQSALVLREGFAYVFRLEGEDRVALTKVALGRRQGDRVEIIDGLLQDARIVESGGAFLADGDSVRVVAGAQP